MQTIKTNFCNASVKLCKVGLAVAAATWKFFPVSPPEAFAPTLDFAQKYQQVEKMMGTHAERLTHPERTHVKGILAMGSSQLSSHTKHAKHSGTEVASR